MQIHPHKKPFERPDPEGLHHGPREQVPREFTLKPGEEPEEEGRR